MSSNDKTQATGESTSTTRRRVMNQASSNGDAPVRFTRRGMMRTTAGMTVGALAFKAMASNAAAGISEFQNVTVNESSNVIVNESGETFKIRGLNIPDPKRLHRTRFLRGKTPIQLVDMLTNNEAGWHPTAIRVPAQPIDIGEHPMGHTGPLYEPGELVNPEVVADDRRKMRPAPTPAFTESQLLQYLDDYYDPIVQRCKERGVYCIIDYHRHWHEQPPGMEEPSFAEHHLPYNSEHTNYWAYNSHPEFGTDAPGSWGWVDQITTNELTPGFDGWDGITSEADVDDSPFAYRYWTVNQDLLDEVLMFWDVVADRYGDEPHVIFEPYNEPTEPAIWGPVQGCGSIKQEPLWDTFVDDFMGPMIDQIRQHQSNRVLLVSVPGWCQSLQGLHWRDFNQAGYSDIAVTWHNYAGHDVSQVHNWNNDTQYQSLPNVEAETGEELTDPYLPVPDSVDLQECWGWQAYEAAGLQNAMNFHPVAVTEFGWINDPSVVHWLRGTTTGQGTLNEYGVPFFEMMENDDRISWVAWCADIRWLPKMFHAEWAPEEGELDLVNDNFYDTPFDQIPQPCPDLPCEWTLMGGEDSGEYVKDRLDTFQDHLVPFVTETVGEPTGPGGDCENGIAVGEYCATDPNGNGDYTDVNGNGGNDFDDVVTFFDEMNSDGVQNNVSAFDFNDNGGIDFDDVVALFNQV